MPRPTTLPALLASLPRAASTSTHPVLVRPASWPATSYYKITRSTLKFRPAKEIATSSTRINPDKLVGGQAKEDTKIREDGEGKEGEEGLEVGELKASGRVWGMLFWDGKYTAPQTKATNARPDPLIDGRTKSKWVVVDPSTLSQAARDLVQSTTPASVASSSSA